MKKILLLATGGTIGSRPTAAGGLAPAITSEELLACVPELADLCEVSAVQVFNLDSTNVGPAQWQSIVRCIKENYDACDGFVIAHGTDTMAYTAAALSYMVQNSAKPVVLTGSQKSIYNRDTDARNNLYRAFGLPGGEHGEMFAALRRWCESGRLAVFTTQVPHEGCDLAVYEVGRAVGELPGVLEARDMTSEAVAVKLMWALGQTEDREKAARLFETPIEYDIM